MNSNSVVSSYLLQPRLANNRRRRWFLWRARLRLIQQSQPQLLRRALFVLAGWSVLAGCSQYLLGNNPVPGNQAPQTAQASQVQAELAVASSVATKPVAAHKLPGGPTGELLPPGTLAPHGTYLNTYARGQCTWYVAGRRSVPTGWGNAVSWYYNATASGWKVGTVPAVGAIAWTSAGAYGHVALVEGVSSDHRTVYIAEMNYQGVGVVSRRTALASSFRYIY